MLIVQTKCIQATKLFINKIPFLMADVKRFTFLTFYILSAFFYFCGKLNICYMRIIYCEIVKSRPKIQ